MRICNSLPSQIKSTGNSGIFKKRRYLNFDASFDKNDAEIMFEYRLHRAHRVIMWYIYNYIGYIIWYRYNYIYCIIYIKDISKKRIQSQYIYIYI